MYWPSTTHIDGNPMGFQRWVNADRSKGIDRKNMDLLLLLLNRLKI
jgi:hypothetical protein